MLEVMGEVEKDILWLFVYLLDLVVVIGVVVVVCLGGGYGGLVMGYEGYEIGEWFNLFGVVVFICDYCYCGKGYGYLVLILDV